MNVAAIHTGACTDATSNRVTARTFKVFRSRYGGGAAARGDPLKERSATSAKECQRGFSMVTARTFGAFDSRWGGGGSEARPAHKMQARKRAGILSVTGANVLELSVEGTASPGA